MPATTNLDLGQTPTGTPPTAAELNELRRLLDGWEIKTDDFTAEIGGRYQLDASAKSVIQVAIAEGMGAGDSFEVQDAAQSWGSLHNVMIVPAQTGFGQKINGDTQVFACDTDRAIGAKLSIVGISADHGVSIK